jgi:hypothetical protein
MQSWVLNETKNQIMDDARLTKRVATLLDSLSVNPEESIPNASDTWAETLGAYRFFDNDKVNFESILSGHRAATLDRIKDQQVILVPQDTTFLNFATEAETKDMGTLRKKDSNQQLLHTSIAITPSRVNLGIVDASLWQRDEKSTGKSRSTKPIEKKESMRWLNHYDSACEIQGVYPDTTVVSIADREGDIHEWFQHAENQDERRRANYIIRAKANRKVEIDSESDETLLLWDYMASLKSLGNYSLNIPRRNGEPGRDASMNVFVSEVTLTGKGKARLPLSLYVVYAKELNPPAGKRGVEWMLLSDLVIEDFDQARVIIEWYKCRWEIETYFRVLKGGCQVQSNRLRVVERMFNCIAVYMIIGWRLHTITMEARRNPDAPCTHVYSTQEWHVIWISRKKEKPPKEIPSIREVTRMLAGLGGFLCRTGDGEPGVRTVWKGYNKLLNYIDGIELVAEYG